MCETIKRPGTHTAQNERVREREREVHTHSIQLHCNVIEEHVDSSNSKNNNSNVKRKHNSTGSRALGVKPIKIKGGKGSSKKTGLCKCLG